MKQNQNSNDAARIAANEKRLATMRHNLDNLETEAEALLNKGDAMTAGDRARLLSIVNVAYHDSGKIEGCSSIDGCAACDFCQHMMQAAESNPLIICGACYAWRDQWKEAAWRRHKLNARILSSVLFTEKELSTLSTITALCRFNEDGDVVNVIHARNLLRIGKTHLITSFGWFYKNNIDVEKGLNAEGYTTRAMLPKNIRFIHSSPIIGIPCKTTWFDDARFTVYPDTETITEAIANGAHECNGRRCRECGYTCYVMTRHEYPVDIAEYLRTDKKSRAIICDRLSAFKASRV